MDVPESWLVEPIRAAYDLDNLRLSDLHGSDVLTAEFELEALLMTGSCVDLTAIKRGQVILQAIISIEFHSTDHDTNLPFNFLLL